MQVVNGKPTHYYSEDRNHNAHYVYVGMDRVFSANFSGMAKVGGTLVDSYNDPASPESNWAPYADISLTYTYLPGSYVQAGFHQDVSETSVATPSDASAGEDGGLTQYQETSVAYLDFTHQFSRKLTGSMVAQYIYSSYQYGAYEGDGENSVSVGVNLSYQFNRYLSADVGYNFDELFSDVDDRGNTRNRVYFGLTATY